MLVCFFYTVLPFRACSRDVEKKRDEEVGQEQKRDLAGHSLFVVACVTACLPIVRALTGLLMAITITTAATPSSTSTGLGNWAPSANDWYTSLMAAGVHPKNHNAGPRCRAGGGGAGGAGL